MTRSFTIPTWLHPKRTIIVFAWICAGILIPSCLFAAVQSIRFHHRAAEVSRLQPGMTREEVIALVGRPEEDDHSTWYYRGAPLKFLHLPFMEPDDMFVEFSAEGRVSYSGVGPD